MRVQSKRKQTRQRRIYATTAVFAVVVVLGVLLPRLFSIATTFVMQPIHTVHTWIEESQSVLPVFVRDRRSLANKIEELEIELANQAGVDASRKFLLEENTRLRALVGADSPQRIAAAVIARPNQLPYDVLQIDRGSDEGVSLGAPVFVNEHVAIGVVTHITPHYAFVELISSSDFKSTVFIGGPNIIAELVGLGGGVARVRVPQGVLLTIGDTVSLPSISTSVLGRLEYIESEPTQAEQFGYLTLPVALQRIHTVGVGQAREITTDAQVIDETIRESLRKQLVVPGMASSSFAIATSTEDVATTTTETSTP